jgi:C4-dicarboxylate-specific signal transduction histidine kinase
MPLLRHIDGQLMVSVKDTGSGIDPEIMSRLFTKFTTKSQTGIGLGLFISKALSKHMGVEFGLKTIRTEKVQHSLIDCPCNPLTSI